MRCAVSDPREPSVTDTPQDDPADVCPICGKRVEASDLAPVLAHLPPSARLPIHGKCFDEYAKETRSRGAAWANSPRGRWTLAGLRLRVIATVIAVSIVTIVTAAPIGIVLAIRGSRLRRAIRSSFLGEAGAVVFVGYRSSSVGAADVRDIFSASWGESAGVVVLSVDVDAPLVGTDLPRVAWEHWGTDPKPLRRQSLVVIPRHGRVTRLSMGPARGEPGRLSRDDLIEARERTARVLQAHTA